MTQNDLILRDSQRRIVRLKLLSNFYKQADLISVFIKTELIHTIFKESDDETLDYNKLELFHIQFTDSLLELLTKIKRRKESQIVLNLKEIEVNNKFINRYAQISRTENDFEIERKFYSSKVGDYLADVYDRLIGEDSENIITDLSSFSSMYAADYYRDWEDSASFEREEDLRYYEYRNVKIESRLMGRLNISGFKVRFVCGYNCNTTYYELFRIFQSDDEFVFNVYNNTFYFLNEDKGGVLDKSHNVYKNDIVQDLTIKNERLVLENKRVREVLSVEVLDVLSKYREILDNMNFLSNSFSIDEETNVLKAMLQLNLDGRGF
ncbi:hypothetical protein [Myroides sp.]|uniref:hypothetical protein n=1 Tax=Myroides sp. TaxID=1874736 RepID=UPI003F37ADD8